jgi:acyl-CoA synthetase (AMP-forming)/AMP-acid ligase II
MAPEQQAEASAASAKLRLQVSGSAPLPVSVKAAWETGIGGGQVILERYGMTETGLIAGTGWENEKRVKVSPAVESLHASLRPPHALTPGLRRLRVPRDADPAVGPC